MAKDFTLTTFSLKAIVLHLSLFGITQTDKVFTKGNAQAPKSNASNTHPFTFFMHDILGGSTPSERIVAGTIVNTQTTNLPFSKPYNRVFPFKGGKPLVDASNSIGTNPEPTSTMVIKNIDKNKVIIDRNSLPYVTPNQLPLGATLEKFLFGRITVIDDEITKDQGSVVIGKAQGFHLASSLDGSSRTMAFTTLFHSEGHDEEDSISFFGVHRTGIQESYIVVVGGTGKYDSAKGYAKIETLNLPEQHITNGVETLLQITVYIS
ncbi:dirigent protein 9-like [Abrus precatorius]|uniref:Dirigent protein n=1 Tax=Abrus precatorius TaxID=3816 RepID=A0A8B8KY26_ABRPR|nr:dirigent protein 9-like [Abrus precatorius]